jgi:hypothetical protein
MPDLIADQFEIIGRAAQGCDVIVGANAHQYAAPSIAERAGISYGTAVYHPRFLHFSRASCPNNSSLKMVTSNPSSADD